MVNDIFSEAVDFFSKEIEHISIMLKGSLRNEYREYLCKKREYYNIAIKSIEQR